MVLQILLSNARALQEQIVPYSTREQCKSSIIPGHYSTSTCVHVVLVLQILLSNARAQYFIQDIQEQCKSSIIPGHRKPALELSSAPPSSCQTQSCNDDDKDNDDEDH